MNDRALLNILLIEDDLAQSELIQFYIANHSAEHQVDTLSTGKDAMEYLAKLENKEENFPDLILLDLKLPQFDGHEILKFLKESDSLKVIPISILTTSNADKDVNMALMLGANSYGVKPMNADIFQKNINILCNFWQTQLKYKPKHGTKLEKENI